VVFSQINADKHNVPKQTVKRQWVINNNLNKNMTKFEIVMGALGALGLIGLFTLIGMDKEINIVLPVVAAVIGWLTGREKVAERAASAILGKKKKK